MAQVPYLSRLSLAVPSTACVLFGGLMAAAADDFAFPKHLTFKVSTHYSTHYAPGGPKDEDFTEPGYVSFEPSPDGLIEGASFDSCELPPPSLDHYPKIIYSLKGPVSRKYRCNDLGEKTTGQMQSSVAQSGNVYTFTGHAAESNRLGTIAFDERMELEVLAKGCQIHDYTSTKTVNNAKLGHPSTQVDVTTASNVACTSAY